MSYTLDADSTNRLFKEYDPQLPQDTQTYHYRLTEFHTIST